MFSREGPSRSAASNGVLAGYLALTAGFVNSGGFVVLGSFTSHVTGSVGRLANDIASAKTGAAVLAGTFIVAFFAGAFVSSLIIGSSRRRVSRAYGVALLVEGSALALFVVLSLAGRFQHARALDAEAALLCFAMGLQNSLVTYLSGAVIRTTHLTGVVTDLGIEAARWFYWVRAGREPDARPSTVKTLLLLTIFSAFVVGAIWGAMSTLRWGATAMLGPAAAILLAACNAFIGRRASKSP